MGGDGHYMKIRLKEDGTAGEMLPVEINYVHDYDQVAILDELEQPIVLKSSKELKGGMKVKLVGGFEK